MTVTAKAFITPMSGDTEVAGTPTIVAPGASYAVAFRTAPQKPRRDELLPPAAADHLAHRTLTTSDDDENIIINRSGRSTYPDRKSVQTSGATPELADVRTRDDVDATVAYARGTLDAVRNCAVPVVAYLNGDAIGGGAELALACDMHMLRAHARIGFVQGRLTITTAWGGGVDLCYLLGPAHAIRMVARCEMVAVDQALAWGMADAVIRDDDGAAGFDAFLVPLAARTPRVTRGIKASTVAWRHRAGYDEGRAISRRDLAARRSLAGSRTDPLERSGMSAGADREAGTRRLPPRLSSVSRSEALYRASVGSSNEQLGLPVLTPRRRAEAMTPIDTQHRRDWVGQTRHSQALLNALPAQALAAVLNRVAQPQAGDALPVPWHWLYFLQTPRSAELDTDGHPRKGEFLPPVPLPRRMSAAGSIEIAQQLKLGMLAAKVSTIQSVELKEGRSRSMVFDNDDHELHQSRSICIRADYRDRLTVRASAVLAPDWGG